MRFQLALILIVLFSRVTLAQEPNTLSESEKRSGWRLIFDGTSTDGFRNYQQETVSDGWQVEDGALVRAEKGAGDLITKDQLEHFEIQQL